MNAPYRLANGGLIDRSKPLDFTFNGKQLQGYQGDTLASALVANGVHLVARSFKYHRPRGFIGAGVEDPCSMVQLGKGASTEPNAKATAVELYDGLSASSVNVWPSVEYDVSAINQVLAPVMTAGFYYKTFMPSQFFWNKIAEPAIRRSAGFGKAPDAPDPDVYDHVHVHCDVIVVGAGPSGLAAAQAAAKTGARVILADEQNQFGGCLLSLDRQIDGASGLDWVAQMQADLATQDEVTLLPRTTVLGLYDQNYLTAVERRTDHTGGGSSLVNPRQRIWHIRAGQVILATGTHERAMVFANNDRPGVMLSGAARTFANRYAALPGRNAVMVTNNDAAYEGALAMKAAGAAVTVVDTRKGVRGGLSDQARDEGIEIIQNASIASVEGAKRVKGVIARDMREDRRSLNGQAHEIEADCVMMSGGYSPAVHLFCHANGKLAYDDEKACFVPQEAPREGLHCVGGVNGTFALEAGMAEAVKIGSAAAKSQGFGSGRASKTPKVVEPETGNPEAIWLLPGEKPPSRSKAKYFVDFQNDSTAADIALAAREGFDSVEHMKRYTLTGFGTDQGKVGNINGLAILAELTGRTIQETGTTTFRPPYTPVTFGALAGRDLGDRLDPIRVTSIHDSHVAAGCEFENVGQWKRPWFFAKPGEDMDKALLRECHAVRTAVGMLDASTLGKIDVQGPDAGEFLDRVYTNMMSTLKPGRVRYGLMLKEDGMVFDDGTVTRIADDRFLLTTTTGGAASVLDHLEDHLQTEWQDLKVYLTSVTEQWATVTITGPKARAMLEPITQGVSLDPDDFPFMSFAEGEVAGLPARIFRISFTGELSYEINVAWSHGKALWDALMEAGKPHGVTPYGTETMHILRAEKGFIIVGQETDGTVNPFDLGMSWIVSKKKEDFIGKRSFQRPDNHRDDRKQLVGLLTHDPDFVLPEGAQLTNMAVELGKVAHFQPPGLGAEPIHRPDMMGKGAPVPMQGHVTSSYMSDALGRSIALALVKGGQGRMGETLYAPVDSRTEAVTIVDPVFYDKEGSRRDG